jgi:predicted amidohydrolase YtcJ
MFTYTYQVFASRKNIIMFSKFDSVKLLYLTINQLIMKLFLSLLLLFATLAKAQRPDLILKNGRIFTSDTTQLYVEALAIKDGHIIATGSSAEIEKQKGSGSREIDLGGRLVVPGFNDAHNHLPGALKSTFINLQGMNPSWQSLVDSIKLAIKKTPEGQFIQASIGLAITNSPEANRFVLDKLAPKHPVLLLSWWGHVGIFNTLALNKFGIAATQPDPKGGFYERMPDHKTLTGKAYEKNAYWPHTSYKRILALGDNEALVSKLQGMTQLMLKAGITSYQNMCTGAFPEDYLEIWKKAGLPFRLRLIRWADMDADGTLSIPSKELPPTTPALPLASVSGTKWLLEGTPLEQGAAQIDAYPGKGDWHGRMNYTVAEMKKMCLDAIARKDQICFHIGGSKTVGAVLDMMTTIDVDWKAIRPRFEHGDEIDYSTAYLEMARKLGVIIVQNPTHFSAIPGMPPPSAVKHGMAMKTLLRSGIPLAIGSDGPFNPYLNIMMATTHPLRPDEAITREEAVIAYTLTAAYAEFKEHEKGTLTKGKVADLAVLSQNIFTIDVPKLMGTESLLTMVNGKIVYDSGSIKVN